MQEPLACVVINTDLVRLSVSGHPGTKEHSLITSRGCKYPREEEIEEFAFSRLTVSGKSRREQISESSQTQAQGHMTQDEKSPVQLASFKLKI